MKNALVVEGGGMRGVFSAGVLDSFLDHAFDPFDLYVGVSAGSCNLGSHLAGQRGRNRRVYADLMTDRRFISAVNFFRGGHWMDLDWLWEAMARLDPMDAAGAAGHLQAKGGMFIIVATDAFTGAPIYREGLKETMFHDMKASSAVPLLYRGFVPIGGRQATDGGVADPLPVRKAHDLGATKIMVIRSRPRDYVKSRDLETLAVSLAALKRPGLRRALLDKPRRYMDSLEFMRRPPRGVRVVEVNPPDDMRSGRTIRDRGALDFDYHAGFDLGGRAMRAWIEAT